MAITIRERRSAERATLAPPDAYLLEAERLWFLEGTPAEVEEIARCLDPWVVDRVTPEVISIRFGNSVGIFKLPNGAVLDVRSGKWGSKDFDVMMGDLMHDAGALPFAAGTQAPLPFDRTIAARDDVLYHAFVYLRWIVGGAPRAENLLVALRTIVADPQRRIAVQRGTVRTDRAHRLDMSALPRMLSNPGEMDKARGPSAESPLARALKGGLPRKVPSLHVVDEIDTPENRFVKHFLGIADAVLRAFRRVHARTDAFGKRLAAEVDELENRLGPFSRDPLWTHVGAMKQFPFSSTVLQRRSGYREIFQHFARLRLASQYVPFDARQLRALLEARDIAALYEHWVFFRVVAAVTVARGAPRRAFRSERTAFEVRAPWGLAVEWDDGTRVLFNASFTKTGAERRSYSLRLRPDVTLVLPDGGLHVFDAKFKVESLPGDDDGEGGGGDEGRAKVADIAKMHAYRDALKGGRSAWVIYPGTRSEEHAHELPGCFVGALPVRPGGEMGGLNRVVARALNHDVS